MLRPFRVSTRAPFVQRLVWAEKRRSFKSEYKFVDLGSQTVTATGTQASPDNSLSTTVDTELHIGTVGLNFHFD